MPFHLNTVMLAGNLTRNPELRVVGTDRSVVQFSLAINRRYKGSDGEIKEEATFVECEAWNRTAELIGQYLVKGSGCFIEGRLKLDSWTDKEGKNRSRLKVVADNVQFLNRPRQDGGEGAGAAGEASAETGDGDVADARGDSRGGAPDRGFGGGNRPANRPAAPGMGRAPGPSRPARAPAGVSSAALGDDQPPF